MNALAKLQVNRFDYMRHGFVGKLNIRITTCLDVSVLHVTLQVDHDAIFLGRCNGLLGEMHQTRVGQSATRISRSRLVLFGETEESWLRQQILWNNDLLAYR
jgi:hypothetical protein